MNPDLHPFATLALLALLAIAVPGEIIFIVACYGVGVIVGQAFAFALGQRYPMVKESRVAAAFGLLGVLAALLILLAEAVS